jgi:uncharacterized Zn finger protein (UPF0148 family)
MKCPVCGWKFNIMEAEMYRGVRKTLVYCPHCKESIEVEGATRKKARNERGASR